MLDADALDAIDRLRARGIKVVVATGRRFEEVLEMGLVARVDGVVAENGAIIAVPAEMVYETRQAGFAELARAALGELAPAFTWGRVVGSGPRGAERAVVARLMRAGIAHRVEFNAQEMMLLPAGVSKATGAAACLHRMGLDAASAWAIGDGENDVSMLMWAGVGIAPANAAPEAKAAADVLVTSAYSRAFVDVTRTLLVRSG